MLLINQIVFLLKVLWIEHIRFTVCSIALLADLYQSKPSITYTVNHRNIFITINSMVLGFLLEGP